MREKLEQAVFVVLLSTLAIVLGVLETMLPIHIGLPGVKLGLANIIVIISLQYLNVKNTLTLLLLKTTLTTLLLGTFSMFFYGFFGAFLSYFSMILTAKLFKRHVSVFGISLVGGVMHNVGQLVVAMIILQTTSVRYYASMLIPLGAITGLLTGYTAYVLLPRLKKLPLFTTNEQGVIYINKGVR